MPQVTLMLTVEWSPEKEAGLREGLSDWLEEEIQGSTAEALGEYMAAQVSSNLEYEKLPVRIVKQTWS